MRHDDFLSQNIGIGKLFGFFEAFVSEPEDVEAGLVAVASLIHLFKPNPNAFTNVLLLRSRFL
jgi:hypothetical protein